MVSVQNNVQLMFYYFCRLRKGKVKMVLGSGQYYCVSHNEEKCSIQLSIIFIPDTDHSAKQRRVLLQYFESCLDELMTDFMQAAKKPVAHLPCYHCDQLHVELQLLLNGKQQHCPIKDLPIPKQYYQDLITERGLYIIIIMHVHVRVHMIVCINLLHCAMSQYLSSVKISTAFRNCGFLVNSNNKLVYQDFPSFRPYNVTGIHWSMYFRPCIDVFSNQKH